MVSKIEAADNEALVLIEEIENGLHPLATERMVEYLIDAATRKKLQVIFTTHSEYALKNLPQEAIWACVDGEAYQGRLSIESLRAMTGDAEKDCVVFVEDDFAKD
jgi:predicted ATPase